MYALSLLGIKTTPAKNKKWKKLLPQAFLRRTHPHVRTGAQCWTGGTCCFKSVACNSGTWILDLKYLSDLVPSYHMGWPWFRIYMKESCLQEDYKYWCSMSPSNLNYVDTMLRHPPSPCSTFADPENIQARHSSKLKKAEAWSSLNTWCARWCTDNTTIHCIIYESCGKTMSLWKLSESISKSWLLGREK